MASIDDILIKDLYIAIEREDPSLIRPDMTEDEFIDLVEVYVEMQKGTPTTRDKKIMSIDFRIQITLACLTYLDVEPTDEDIYEVLRQNGWKISNETFEKDVAFILKGMESLIAKKKALEDDIVKSKNNNSTSDIYFILATMSAGLDGIYLDPRKVTVREFLSYQKVLKEKNERYEKLKSQKNGNRQQNKR